MKQFRGKSFPSLTQLTLSTHHHRRQYTSYNNNKVQTVQFPLFSVLSSLLLMTLHVDCPNIIRDPSLCVCTNIHKHTYIHTLNNILYTYILYRTRLSFYLSQTVIFHVPHPDDCRLSTVYMFLCLYVSQVQSVSSQIQVKGNSEKFIQ